MELAQYSHQPRQPILPLHAPTQCSKSAQASTSESIRSTDRIQSHVHLPSIQPVPVAQARVNDMPIHPYQGMWHCATLNIEDNLMIPFAVSAFATVVVGLPIYALTSLYWPGIVVASVTGVSASLYACYSNVRDD